MSDTTPERLDAQQLAALFAASPYISGLHLGVQAIDYATSTLTLRMPLHAALERRVGTKQFHGGAIAALRKRHPRMIESGRESGARV